ncbi:unnamed protein product [Arctia plantaginis]|uniref:CRC domain-containing protein n=1 Tax=Arctia plantaginis TaxID=874455 RepID=A0A8S0ZR12_ARCPL|nr:unnamed protein product [Arctia plantaginis]
MDHNLDESLNLDSAMGSMDFDHSGVVVTQEDIALETTGHEGDIPMEFENIEEQPMLMDTGNEEIIVSDFMGEEFTLQEYATQDTTGVCETVDVNHLNILSQSESMIDLKFDPEMMTQSVAPEILPQTKYIQVKAAVAPPRTIKKEMSTASTLPRQVAIAPKPPKLTPAVSKPSFTSGKQFAIAPKPVTLVANKNASLVKKMALTGVIQGGAKTGNAVLTQIGKQLVMVPAGSGQKIKLVTSGSGMSMQYVRPNADQSQLITTKQISGSSVPKPLVGKIIVQAGQPNVSNIDPSNQPAVITKLMPSVSTAPHTRYVMQQKTVPISIGGTKVFLTSPTKQGMKFKKQIISIQSPTPKLLPATTQSATTTKKVVITANPTQNVILKTTAPPNTAQVSKEGQITQLHQISVPGKGIQYIRLITNPTPAPQKPQAAVSLPSKSFVLTDTKGNLIYMSGQNLVSDEPPPLITTGSATTPKMTSKPQKKLVRIAPVAAKPAPSVTQHPSRSSQSLLAPLSPIETIEQIEQTGDLLEERVEIEVSGIEGQEDSQSESKAALRALLGDVGGATDYQQEHHDELRAQGHLEPAMHEVEVEFERQQTPVEEDPNSMDALDSSHRSDEHPLIVIPSSYGKQAQIRVSSDNSRRINDSKDYPNMQVNIEGESLPAPYLSPKQSQAALSESGDLGLRPRKACNCTKSQCLKLYCDCFANGEFCNRCNCNNCHNNLENEELRQKAIRACLDRNPNAFRPKIGKAKSGGPDIVRRHNKGCNCKRSGCLKNYCECYEAKIACTTMCKCVGCRNVEETLERRRDAMRLRDKLADPMFRPPTVGQVKQPCSFMTSEVIEAVCQCLIAAAVSGEVEGEGEGDGDEESGPRPDADPIGDVIEEFARCLQDIISASHQSTSVKDEGQS